MRKLLDVVLDDAAEVCQNEFQNGAADQNVVFVLASQNTSQALQPDLADVKVPDALVVRSADHGKQIDQNVLVTESDGAVHRQLWPFAIPQILENQDLFEKNVIFAFF